MYLMLCVHYIVHSLTSSSSPILTPQCPLVECVCKQLFGRTFLRGFVSTLPLPTRVSSVPLLSLRTHPTSFPCSNSLVRYGWEGDLAHAETESWHGLLPAPEKAGYHSLWTGISSSLFPAASSWNSTDVKGAPCLRIAEKWFRISDCCHP